MSAAKITISMDEQLLLELDLMVQSGAFASRSQAVQAAVREKVSRGGRTRLAQACAKLDPAEEQALAEEGMTVRQ